MNKLHRLLKRQLKKVDIDPGTRLQLEPFLEQVNQAYTAFDNDLSHMETILEKSSVELYEANQQLKNNVELITGQLSKIAGNIKDVIFEMDLGGKWSYLNPAWETLTGLKVADNLGRPYYEFLRDEHGKPLKKLINLNDPNFKPFSKRVKCLMPDRQIKWFDFSLKAVKSDKGKAEGYIGTLVDISDLKETEYALIQAKEKETKANKAKDDFLSTMSHEIRTPLNAVIGVSHLLLMEDPKKEQLENLQALKYSSEHLLGLVNDILDFNKIASGSLQLEEADFSLEQVLNGLQSIFHNKAKKKDITFVIKKDNSIPKILVGDSTRISQILTNLINNAIKFTEEGRVILDIEMADETDDTHLLRFEVKDTGIGIPADKQGQIFQSFAQANTDTTRKYGGTGLGLAICKQLLEIMGSAISLESEIGKGSSFTFYLNLQKSHLTDFQEEEEDIVNYSNIQDQKGLGGIKILVVEDNKLNIMVIKKLFTRWKIDFDIAENGLIGLKMATANCYDMILMDLQMPVMNGFESCKSIRDSHNPLNKVVPIYALSASTGVDIKDEIKEYGMDGLICKPFDPAGLYKTLAKIAQQERVA
ncbi:ATP-binding protein [Flavobacteriaceae bacterium 3-367]|uniref:PAS domain-containing hybrid sensor histidine kinase/response regulator n=1 Tax=Eudoraea algarum TaxID=3417568 RepID=UPI00326E076C